MAPLNGDAKILYDKIEDMEKEHRRRHQQNTSIALSLAKTFDELKDKVLTLPCNVHVEKFKKYDSHIVESDKWRMAVFSMAVGLLVTIGGGLIAWGQIKQKVDDHIKYTETSIGKLVEKGR